MLDKIKVNKDECEDADEAKALDDALTDSKNYLANLVDDLRERASKLWGVIYSTPEEPSFFCDKALHEAFQDKFDMARDLMGEILEEFLTNEMDEGMEPNNSALVAAIGGALGAPWITNSAASVKKKSQFETLVLFHCAQGHSGRLGPTKALPVCRANVPALDAPGRSGRSWWSQTHMCIYIYMYIYIYV